jgi:hypothetical protein
MTDKYIVRSGATTNTLLKGQLRMKVNFSLVLLGAVAASAIALPAQAATVRTTNTNVGGNVEPVAAYRVEGVAFDGVTYNVDFDHGSFNEVYNPAQYFGASLATGLGNAIITALNAANVTRVVEQIGINTYGQDIKTEFYIPIAAPVGVGAADNRVAFCTIPTICNSDRFQNPNGPVMYAKFSAATTPPDTGTTPVPTPALIPGLLGMGLAAMRKKQQAAIVAQEA